MICIERLHDDCGLIRAAHGRKGAHLSLSYYRADRMQKLLFAAHLADFYTYLLVCGRSERAIKIAGAFMRVISWREVSLHI